MHIPSRARRTLSRIKKGALSIEQACGLKHVRLLAWRKLAERNLRAFGDALAGTAIDGRYFMHGGALIGWNRDGRLLLGDLGDFDFGYKLEDRASFEQSVPNLERHGFKKIATLRNSDGEITVVRFHRGFADYDFFCFWPQHSGRIRTYSFNMEFDSDTRTWEHVENVHEWTDQKLGSFSVAGRKWLKFADHRLYLEENYGAGLNDPSWSYLMSPTIIARHRCPDPERTPIRG